MQSHPESYTNPDERARRRRESRERTRARIAARERAGVAYWRRRLLADSDEVAVSRADVRRLGIAAADLRAEGWAW